MCNFSKLRRKKFSRNRGRTTAKCDPAWRLLNEDSLLQCSDNRKTTAILIAILNLSDKAPVLFLHLKFACDRPMFTWSKELCSYKLNLSEISVLKNNRIALPFHKVSVIIKMQNFRPVSAGGHFSLKNEMLFRVSNW